MPCVTYSALCSCSFFSPSPVTIIPHRYSLFLCFLPHVCGLSKKRAGHFMGFFTSCCWNKRFHRHCVVFTEQLRSRLKEYGLVTPFSTDSHGHYLSHLLSATHKQRMKREVFSPGESEEKLFFNISAFGKEFHLRLRPNNRLVAPGAMVEWHDEVLHFVNASNSTESDASVGANQTESSGTERILRRELLKTDCTFVGDITDVPGASVAINNCDGLVSPPLP